MGDIGELKAKYERLSGEVRYLQSFLPRDVGLPARVRNASVWKSDLVRFTDLTQDKLNQGELATDGWVVRIGTNIYGAFDLLEKNGGIIQYYEGDAGIAVFDDPMEAILGAAAVKSAIRKLPEEELASKERIKLNIRQGLATGKVFTGTAGDEHRRIPVICGQALEDAYRLEGQADPEGIVRVHRNTYELTKDLFDFKPDNDAYELASEPQFSIERKDETKKLQPDYQSEIQHLELRKAQLLSYFPPLTRDELQGKQTGKVEHATILFGELPTLGRLIRVHQEDSDKLAEVYNAHFKLLKDIVEDEFGGEIDKMYRAVFMARFRKDIDHEEDDTRVRLKYREAAKQAALKLTDRIAKDEHIVDLLREAGLRHFTTRVEHERPNQGLSRGKVYIGPVGSEKRKAFTMLGGIVNKAARQMKDVHDNPEAYSQADGIATDDSEGATLVRKVNLKGIGETNIYGLDKASMTKVMRKKTLVGRDAELAQIASLVQTVNAGEKQLVNIVADAGYGKTELTRELERQFREKGGKIYKASAVEQARDIPDYLFQDFARNALKIRPGDAEADVKQNLEKITDAESRKVIHHWLGLNIKGYEKPSASSKEELEKARKQALLHLIDAEKPKLLIFNDIHWADENSLATLEWLSKELGPRTLITANYRPKEINREYLWQRIELGALDEQGTSQLAYHLTGNKPDAKLAEFILKHSHGIPLYIEEIVHYLKDNVLIADGRLTKDIDSLEIPDSIEKLILARYRNLKDASKQEVLDYASCMFGDEFPKKLLENALGKKEGELDSILVALQRADFIKLNNGTIAFKHNLTKNAVHDYAIRPTDRVKRHTRIGDARKELYGEGADQLVALAWDYENGEDSDKGIEYNWKTARSFTDLNENDTTIKFCTKVENIYAPLHEPSVSAKKFRGSTFNTKALALQRLDKTIEALREYADGFNFVNCLPENDKNEVLLKLHLNRGVLYKDILHDSKSALNDFESVLNIAQTTANKMFQCMALINKSLCQDTDARIKTSEQALQVFEMAAKENPALRLSYIPAFIYLNLCEPYRVKKDYDQAEKVARMALSMARQIKNVETETRSLVGLANTFSGKADCAAAEQNFLEAESVAKRVNDINLLSMVYSNWIEFCIKQNNFNSAIQIADIWLNLDISSKRREEIQKKKEEVIKLRASS